MSFGTMYSWTSPALPFLRSNESKISITNIESSTIAALNDAGALFGNVIFLFLSGFIGRKYWIFMLAVPYTLSWLMIIFAKNVYTLYASRILGGFTSDMCFCLTTMYLGEIADKEIRGMLLTGIRIFLNLGHVYVKTAGAFLSYKTMNIMMFVVPLIFLATFLFMPESPYYLLLNNRREEALKTLMKLKGVTRKELVNTELERLQTSVKKSKKNQKSMFRELFCIKAHRKSFSIVLIAWMTSFLSGRICISAFTQDIFKETEIPLSPEICTIIITIVSVKMTIVSAFIIERIGRRISFILSGLFCALVLLMVGLFFFLKTHLILDVKSITWLPLLGLIVYEVAFALGLSYIPIVLLGEMFALNIKIPAGFVISIIANIFIIFLKATFAWLNNIAGIYTTFWIYAICSVVGSLTFVLIAPETKGKTLEEIQEHLNAKSKRKIQRDPLNKS
ncbi:facilitated trehalose transporter Tret1-like isoform X2 [Belonocnema kinseyi]|nr:facilitated trehalose transporter Tret1-like isoform X2 [Belonocnema kinseyi]